MYFKIINKIKKEIETLNYESYAINIELKDKTIINLSKNNSKEDNAVGFKTLE